MRHRQPRRDDEDVARTPRERQTADLAAPVPFDRAVDRRVGGSVGLSGEPRRQPLNERRNRRHRIAAGRRIHVLHLDAVTPVDRPVAGQRVEDVARTRVRIAEHRRGHAGRRVFERQQAAAISRERVALAARHGLHLFVVMVGEARAEHVDDRHVEAVEPDDRRLARITVVVKRPERRQHEVSRPHRRPLAVDGGVGRSVSLEDEAHRRCGVPVAGRDLSRHHELHAGVQALRDLGGAAQARVLEHEDATLRFLRRDETSGVHQQRTDLVVAPHRGHAGAHRLGRHELREHFPQRRRVLLMKPPIQILALRGRSRSDVERGRVHHVLAWLSRVRALTKSGTESASMPRRREAF